HMEIVSSRQCKGNDDLLKMLNTVVSLGGEGLMAVEPHSLYAAGERTKRLLKVKVQDDNEVQVMEVISTGLFCRQRNGRECIVGCSQKILENPPSIGSVITVKHI